MIHQSAFERSEYERRVCDVKQRMEVAGFDLLICQDPANMNWLTGFDGWSFYTPQAVLIHLKEAAPIWFGRAQDSKSATLTTDLPTTNIVGYSEPLVHHATKHPFDELCDLINYRGWGSCWIGVELDAHYYTARAHQHILNGLPNAKVLDNGALVNWARLVKSEAELVYMREAGRIVSETMDAALFRLKPGLLEYEVVADVYHSQITGVDGKFGDCTSICPLIQVGEGTCTPHLMWTDNPIPESGLVVMEFGAARRRYHAPLTRTAHIGKPPALVSRLADVVIEGGDVAIAAAKPGMTCAEIEAIWQKVLKKNGYSKPSRVGYSIGLNYPPDWGERTASLRDEDNTVLQAGMCFHFQSGVWLEEFGAAISEPFIVTNDGGERLCSVDRILYTIDG
jgi:Xaa-Pro aminopeptidase